MTVSCHKGEWK